MPNLQNLPGQVQPMTGDASVEAALAALSPQEQALVAQGIDPYADGNEPSIGSYPPGVIPNGEGLSPEQRVQLGAQLQELLAGLPKPSNPADAKFMTDIASAIEALSAGESWK